MISTVKFAKLKENAISPFRKNPTDSGLDFYSIEDVEIPPHSFKIVHTGITIEIPVGYGLFLKPKGKNNHLIGAGVIDSLYEPGEVLVKVCNINDFPLNIKMYEPIAQGIYLPVETPILQEVNVPELKNNSARSCVGGIVAQSKE